MENFSDILFVNMFKLSTRSLHPIFEGNSPAIVTWMYSSVIGWQPNHCTLCTKTAD